MYEEIDAIELEKLIHNNTNIKIILGSINRT